MEIKKNSQADLEKLKLTFILFGLAVALGLMVITFNWTSVAEKAEDLGVIDAAVDEEQVINTVQNIPPPPPQQQTAPQVIEVLNIVEDEKDIKNEIEIEDTEADDNTKVEIVEIEEVEEEAEPEIFFSAEEMPEYPGGNLALQKFIAETIVYPAVARETDLQGKVYVQFEVNKRGEVDKVTVVRGVDPILDNEAIRVVKLIKGFKPGKQRGKPVSVWYTVPINFKLNN